MTAKCADGELLTLTANSKDADNTKEAERYSWTCTVVETGQPCLDTSGSTGTTMGLLETISNKKEITIETKEKLNCSLR